METAHSPRPRTLRAPLLFGGALVALLTTAALMPRQQGPRPQPPAAQAPSQVDLVLAIDTSSSMDGLIDGARQQLWEAVSRIAKSDPKPVLRVGLISYGNTSYDSGAGWVRVDADLTTDLDAVYGQLFALRTGGGDEYVARALQRAARLGFRGGPGTRRMVIVAGNEPADQDPAVPLPAAVSEARERGITVHTIYCGSAQNGEARLWADLARRGAGQYAVVDHNEAVAVSTPVDAELARLSQELSGTYLAYGAAGRQRAENQVAQDNNAGSLGLAAAASRAVAKSSGVYKNAEWDLVDAAKDGKLADVREEDLPAELRGKSEGERQAALAERAKKRDAIQKRINELSAERGRYLSEGKAKRAALRSKSGKRSKSLDEAMDALF